MKLIKTTTALVAVAGFLAVAEAPAHAMEDGMYGALRAGYGMRSSKIKSSGNVASPAAAANAYVLNSKKAQLKGANFEVALGYQAMPEVRMELALAHKMRKDSAKTDLRVGGVAQANAKLKDLKADSSAAMLDAYYDIHAGDFTPFLMGGVGFMRSKASTKVNLAAAAAGVTTFKINTKNANKFAWNVGAGAAYDIDSSFKLELMYKLANGIKEYKIKNTNVKAKLSNGLDHSVMAGVRYHF
jgi:opacity protein-like surface antigen